MVFISNSFSYLSNYKNASNANFGSFEKPLMNILCFMKCSFPLNYIHCGYITSEVSSIEASLHCLQTHNVTLETLISFP